jgi:hypothetical protein
VNVLERLLRMLRGEKFPPDPLVFSTEASYMQGTLKQPYTWSGKNTQGQTETLSAAKVWIGSTLVPAANTRLIQINAQSGDIEADVDLPAGSNAFQAAPVDNEGTEGARTNGTVVVADAAPEAFQFTGTAAWIPKP